ncbi:hypothetical protein GGR52DRAFT_573656 [Hypoxylon sp. FL1284]|nr:hypothetical protein GGR52DRAFT_573656 [Hypoxylon sp. FL1284]
MIFPVYTAAVISAFLAATVTAAPNGEQLDVRSIRLDNGERSVNAVVRGSKDGSVIGDSLLMARQSNIDCKGSAFCERLGDSCDDALRKVDAGKEYTTTDGSKNTGTCSGTCGLFLSGNDCKGKGQELIDAYHAIRSHGCSHCGRYKRDSDGCLIKIDRVTGC